LVFAERYDPTTKLFAESTLVARAVDDPLAVENVNCFVCTAKA
jgi:hypothetical protein